MIALACDWQSDLSVGPTGDIAVLPVETEVQQRIVRRLLTSPGGYIWHIDYGAGLGNYVGQPYSKTLIEGTVLNQLQNEVLVETSPSPSVRISQPISESFSGTVVTIQYQIVGAPSGNSVVLGLGK